MTKFFFEFKTPNFGQYLTNFPNFGCKKTFSKKSGSDLTKNYCITVSMQKISLIHKFIFKVQQILGSNELNGSAHF